MIRVNAEGHGLLDVWMSHGDKVVALPPGFKTIATMRHVRLLRWRMRSAASMACNSIRRSLTRCRARPSSIASCATYADSTVIGACLLCRRGDRTHRSQVGSEEVLLGLSGGVDSAVAAALVHRAIGRQLTCVFVDNGLLRLNEAEQVMQTLSDLGAKVLQVDASAHFMGDSTGVTDPEQKRKIIGRVFVEVFQREAARLPQ